MLIDRMFPSLADGLPERSASQPLSMARNDRRRNSEVALEYAFDLVRCQKQSRSFVCGH